MADRATAGLTHATATAERLVREGVPFRRAHHQVGQAALAVVEGRACSLGAALEADGRLPAGESADLRPEAVWWAAEFGGGPGPTSFRRCHEPLASRWEEHRARPAREAAGWGEADERLWDAVTQVHRRTRGTAAVAAPVSEEDSHDEH
jgi:argininosuccinate lyase